MPSLPPKFDHSQVFDLFLKLLQPFTDIIKTYGSGFDLYADKMASWKIETLKTKLNDFVKPMKNGFQVINHGDFWCGNTLLKSDGKDTIDVMFIDFPNIFVGSPLNDILFFLLTSVDDEIKVDYFDEFVEFYHKHLTTALQQLGYCGRIPTLEEMYEDLLPKRFLGKIIF